jgi:cyclohexa-1,5-dienecarbonyl-CoA hydratase
VSAGGVTVDRTLEGEVYVRLDNPPGNVLDTKLCGRLLAALGEAAAYDDAKLLVLAGTGKHFSFGASIEEHLPAGAPDMLAQMRAVVVALYAHPYPTLAAVRGRCLGGGLEVALACDMVIAERSAVLAAPEIRLGVFAPAATVLLQASVPRCVAAEVLLTGRDLSAEEALRYGLINRVVDDGELDMAVAELAAECFAPRSAVSLRQATAAYRDACDTRRIGRIAEELGRAERRYLDQLLPTHDGVEGIRAFLAKRQPAWEERR